MQTKRKTTKTQESSDNRGRKRNRDTSTEKVKMEDNRSVDDEYQLEMPKSLKDILIEDWENINKEDQIVVLPSKMTVTDILDRYLQSHQMNGNNEMLEQTVQGLKLYFNHTLGNMLLYRSERKQYEELVSTKPLVDIYGGEHFLRLFVELPTLMSQANVDDETLEIMKSTFMDILIFLQDNEKEIFMKTYQANRNR
ncbi:MRG domain-containing protein [Halteromyces radiatus]|uniref:MRG domain-containing protein n=1 Tax=Halteromyces radiatus TaxID=101107 RepID=UPI00221E7506|nr:MRG domain-containing protein [Halteromyces radiatus]KAI8077688.1 MRG domain-containing protein [Halteromyces radiatus]